MKTLHILNKQPENSRFRRCLETISASDQLLLTENAVLALTCADLTLPKDTFALSADVEARGVPAGAYTATVDYEGMVKLSANADRVICW